MLDLEIATTGRRWQADLAAPLDLAIRLQFPGPQPRYFATEPARAAPLRAGSFSGSVADGASCNCNEFSLAPHCHGTHTECVGHVTDNAVAVAALTPVPPVPPALAALVTELAYVPDGLYLLALHVPAFDADAAPSRPVLYPVTEAAP